MSLRFQSCVICLIYLIIGCKKRENLAPPPNDSFIKAVDISAYPEIKAAGFVFHNAVGVPEDFLSILKNNGVNTIRLRLWVNPDSGYSSFSEVKSFSSELRAHGFKIWLSLHYSDTWADPGNQKKPANWHPFSFQQLRDTVHAYTYEVASEIQPEIIQIGNEINHGLLFPEGKRNNTVQFHELLMAGIVASRNASPNSRIMLHYAGFAQAQQFFSEVDSLDYDLIGLSYYPIWHGKNLDSLQRAMSDLASNFHKHILIAETAYPFTLQFNDLTHNIVGLPHQLIPMYPATPFGQKEYLTKVKDLVSDNELGQGFCYWGAELVAWKGQQSTTGSPWENQAVFDFNHSALPVLEVFQD